VGNPPAGIPIATIPGIEIRFDPADFIGSFCVLARQAGAAQIALKLIKRDHAPWPEHPSAEGAPVIVGSPFEDPCVGRLRS
jgi:hypothetical protein